MATTLWQTKLPSLGIGCVLCKILPMRIKRMVVLSCLFGYIASESFDESLVMERLNREFSFCKDKEALRLPTRLAMHFREKTIEQPINIPHERGPLYKLAVDIVASTAPGIRYATLTEMREDVLRVLRMAL